jgi:hypothetical protein
MTKSRAIEMLEHMLWCMGDEPPHNLTNPRDVKEWEDEHKKIRETFEVSIKCIKESIDFENGTV